MNGTGFAVIGAGPAGLSAAYDLAKRGIPSVVLEQDDQVGGLSKTAEYHGYRCDIGGHRFFTKSAEVDALWREVLPNDLLRRPRISRICYRGKLFSYPLRPVNALVGLGPLTSARALGSYAVRKLFPRKPEASFEDWVSNRFGKVLYSIFFKTYTEKVWGIPCSEISADWAAQRIRNLNLGRAVLNALGVGRGRNVASLIDEFDYPRLGPGQMYETMSARAQENGAQVLLRHKVKGIEHANGRITALRVEGPAGGERIPVSRVISSMPITDLVSQLDPPAPPEVQEAARLLRYRSILTVNLIVRQAEVLPDTWIYIHTPEVAAGRLQMYKNWSTAMVPDPSMSVVGLEYFAFEGDKVWSQTDLELIECAKRELNVLGFVRPDKIEDGFVVRYPKAYPIYDRTYAGRLELVRRHLSTFSNLACVGRYGQFRYNNMDHSIMSALLAVRRLLGENVDPWRVNEEAQYLEERPCDVRPTSAPAASRG